VCFFLRHAAPRYLHSFPTRRSSDLPVMVFTVVKPNVGSPICTLALRAKMPCPGLPVIVLPPGRSAVPWMTVMPVRPDVDVASVRSEEHTSELQSRSDLVCRLLLEKK